ncbi:MAG: DUF6502 family protein [Steroidobacteraceae bacterium]
MDHLQGHPPRQSRRLAFDVLRPLIRLLRAAGIPEVALNASSERALRLYRRTPARGVWLDSAVFSKLTEILSVWARDPAFIDEKGMPQRLSLGAGPGSFAALVRLAGGSVGARRALVHLLALGAVRRCDGGRRVRLVSNVLVGVMGGRFLVAPMLDAVRRFSETVEHNLCERPGVAGGRLHRWAGSASLDPRQLREMQRFVRSSGQTFLDAVDEKLAACAAPARSRRAGKKLTYGVGVYVFMDEAPGRRDRQHQGPRRGPRIG